MKIPANRVYEIISELVNDLAVEIVKRLKNRSNVSEFKLAEELGLEINIVRNHLYKLYDLNLVSFKRKKDQKKGWYIHYWTFNQHQVRFVIIKFLKSKIEKLEERLAKENEGHYYICDEKCIRFSFEQATDYSYKCPECGELLNLEDNSAKKTNIEEELKTVQAELAEFTA